MKDFTDSSSTSSPTNMFTKWKLLTALGPRLRNSRNNCWFHASLVFLGQIPSVRERCLLCVSRGGLVGLVAQSILAVCDRARSPSCLEKLFDVVKDFSGVANRYRQNSAADFIDYIVLAVPTIFSDFTSYSNTLKCLDCKWVSIKTATEPTYKLYFTDPSPPTIRLQDLVFENSVNILRQSNKAFCGHCNRNTDQSSSCSFLGKVIILELMRVIISNNLPRKCSTSVTFSLHDYVTLPGSVERFRIVGVCHHSGNVKSGHWFSGITLDNGSWFMIDDLSVHRPFSSVDHSSSKTITLLLLIADSMFK